MRVSGVFRFTDYNLDFISSITSLGLGTRRHFSKLPTPAMRGNKQNVKTRTIKQVRSVFHFALG